MNNCTAAASYGMKSFQQKKEELSKLKDRLTKAKIVVFSSFAREGEKGLNVSEMGELKRGLKALDSEYLVEKKTLLDKALASRQPATPKESLRDPTGQASNPRPSAVADSGLGQPPAAIDIFKYPGSLGVAFGYGDEQSAAKTIYNFAKKHPALKYFGAIWNGKFMNPTQFTEFARLPSKEIMIARLLGMMKYPIAALANILDQIAKNKN